MLSWPKRTISADGRSHWFSRCRWPFMMSRESACSRKMLKSVTGSTWGPWEFHSELEMGKSWIHLDGISYLLSKVESIWASEQMSKPGMQLKAMSLQVGVSISRLKVHSVSWFGPFQFEMFALWVRLKKHTIIWIYLDIWDDGIMSASCFPTNPNCSRCLMIKVC